MKKLTIWVSVLMLGAMAFQSCSTIKTNSIAKAKEPHTADVYADLDIRTEKITHSTVVTVKNNLMMGINEDELKDNAIYEALKKVGADVLVAPQFKITEMDKCIEIIVTGYPAYYTNLRQKPIAEKTELKELKDGASYIVLRKDKDNNLVEVDKEIITVPSSDCKIDVNNTVVDQVVLTNDNKKEKK